MTTRSHVANLLPSAVAARIASSKDRESFTIDVARYVAMSNSELFTATKTCLHNLPYLPDESATGDAYLRVVLVPELWERITPRSRDVLRRLSTSLAEYRADQSSSFWRRVAGVRLGERADRLRSQIAAALETDVASLVEQVRFAIAGSSAAKRWPPAAFVYEPAFTYRLVPVIARRALDSTTGV